MIVPTPIDNVSITHIKSITIFGVLTGFGLTFAGWMIVKAGVRS
jgi:hypothetical protein